MAQSRRILWGLVGGIALGLFLGDRAAFLEWPAKAFVQLLQVTVLPYLVVSLIVGIAGRKASDAARLAARAGIALLVLWCVSLALVFLATLALPPDKGGSFFATTLTEEQPRIDWIDLYIPANPFRSLANNVVPAVVVFSVLLGIALLGLPGKDRVVGSLRLVTDWLGRAGTLVVRFTPLGLFAIAGHAAGVLRVEEFERLQAYLLVSTGMQLILMLWILPGLVAAVSGVSHRRVLALARDPMLTAFFTANLFVVLPLLQERAKALVAETNGNGPDAAEAVDVLIPTSFTVPHGAKLLSLWFVLFAGWFAGSPVSVGHWPAFAGVGVLSLFGSLNTAIPFLLDLVRLPADLFQLFLISGVVGSMFGSAAAAMHTFALALLGARFLTHRGDLDWMRLARFAGTSAIVVGVFLLGSRLLLGAILPPPEAAAGFFDELRPSGFSGRLAAIEPPGQASSASVAPAQGHRFEHIISRGSLRVCVSPGVIPWCYTNRHGDIVGFEVDVAHALAVDLNVRLSLVSVSRLERGRALVSGACDVATGRMMPSASTAMAFSRPLAQERWAFLVPDHLRGVFASLERLRELPAPRIAVLDQRELVVALQAAVPQATIVPLTTIGEFIEAPPDRFDAMFTGYDRAAAQSLVHPRLAAVVPEPGLGSVPIAITVPKGEDALLDLANAVVEFEQANGVLSQRLDYWIGGVGHAARKPRWSIGHDVLGWW